MRTLVSKRTYKKSMRCLGCWEVNHLPIFIRGPLAVPYRLAGIGTSEMHPNTCTLCEKKFKGLMKTQQIRQPVTILFADVRNYTSLSSEIDTEEISELLGIFYGVCAEVIWEREGIINKLIGDAVLALFNFPFRRSDHVARGVEAAFEIQRRYNEIMRQPAHVDEKDGDVRGGIGIGVHTGETLIGQVGQYLRDFTVIGPVVNLASRLQSAAAPGEVLVSDEAYQQLGSALSGGEERLLNLKGIGEAVRAYGFSPEATEAEV